MKGSSKLSSNISILDQPGLQSLVFLAMSKHVLIKISGLYRSSALINSNFSDLELLVKYLAAEVPDQLIWASDWPHTGDGKDRKGRSIEIPESFRQIDNAGVLRQLKNWCGDECCSRLMVKNPSKLFG
jgi:predicted TIM-barrel fold metal-dependent hydrolase